MEILKTDMTKDEIQHTVEILLDLDKGELAKLTAPTLTRMMNTLMKQAAEYNHLEDKHREALQDHKTYFMDGQKKGRKRYQKNTSMARALRNAKNARN